MRKPQEAATDRGLGTASPTYVGASSCSDGSRSRSPASPISPAGSDRVPAPDDPAPYGRSA